MVRTTKVGRTLAKVLLHLIVFSLVTDVDTWYFAEAQLFIRQAQHLSKGPSHLLTSPSPRCICRLAVALAIPYALFEEALESGGSCVPNALLVPVHCPAHYFTSHPCFSYSLILTLELNGVPWKERIFDVLAFVFLLLFWFSLLIYI